MRILSLLCLLMTVAFVTDVTAQKKSPITRVCGDPSATCARRAVFKDEDIPFEYSEGAAVAESAPFYIVVLMSTKLAENAECENTPEDFSRENIQWNFLKNKVFIARGCYSIENNFYNKLGNNVIALAVFAGHTKAAADLFLKKVKAVEHIDAKDAYLLRITTGFNGT